jgi:hypothetical protein
VKNLVMGFLFGAAAMAVAIVLLRPETPVGLSSRPEVPVATLVGSAPSERERPGPVEAAIGTTSTAQPSTPHAMRASVADTDAGVPASGPPPTAEIPGGALDEDAASRTPLKQLLEAFRIDCQYGPGFGGRWPKGELLPHGAAWQGGPITFDTIDLDAGTAKLKNSSGFTRTLDGELEVRVHATDTGLHFTVFAPGGELIVASVYGALDTQRRNAAVASFHGPYLEHESAQFYGACTLA